MKSAFIPYKERLKYIYDIIKPGYQKMRERILSFNSNKGENEETIR